MIPAELEKRLDLLFNRYAALDNAEYLLSSNLAQIKGLADRYKVDLADILFSLIDEKTIAQVTAQAAHDYAKTLAAQIKSGAINKAVLDRRKLVEGLLETWKAQADSIAANSAGNLYAKGAQFQAVAVSAKIPLQRVAEIAANEITSATIGGVQYNYRALSSLWEQMNKAYGQRDTIQFRNGTNYPLRTYVDARKITTRAEAHRAATIIEASSDGLWFGTTNKTGTTDSCIYHEGEIFFLSDEARAQAVAKYGNRPELARMSTWQEIVADKTHMGKFGCKHIVRPMTLQFKSEEKALQTLSENPPQAVPEKIDEKKVFEMATGREWVNPESKPRNPNYEPIQPNGPKPEAYTIA